MKSGDQMATLERIKKKGKKGAVICLLTVLIWKKYFPITRVVYSLALTDSPISTDVLNTFTLY